MTTSTATEPARALASIPSGLRQPLLDEYNKLARHFREGRWEPAGLNGGKFCEIVYTILKGHIDGAFPATPSKPANMVAACSALAQATAFSRSVRIQIPRMLIALYEIRNNRNIGHVGADVDPNHMDATVVLAMTKWILAELIRIFHGMTTDEATKVVEALADRTLPIVWRIGDKVRILGSDLSAKDKLLVLLYGSAGPVLVQTAIDSLEYSNPSRFRNGVLKDAHKRDLIHFDKATDTVQISPIGSRYVEQNIDLAL